MMMKAGQIVDDVFLDSASHVLWRFAPHKSYASPVKLPPGLLYMECDEEDDKVLVVVVASSK